MEKPTVKKRPWNKGLTQKEMHEQSGYVNGRIPKFHPLFKICSDCKIEKQRKYFQHTGSKHIDGTPRLHKRCQDCQNIYRRNHLHKNFYGTEKHKLHLQKQRLKREQKNPNWKFKNQGRIPKNRKLPLDHSPLYKVCGDCNQEKYYTDFTFSNKNIQGGKALSYHCRSCGNIRRRKYFANFSEEKRRKHKEKQKMYSQNPKSKANVKKLSKKYRDILTDTYVRKSLANSSWNFPANKIPDDLVQLQRLKLMIERKIRPHLMREH